MMSLQVLVRDNNIDQALRVLKKKMQREGLFREMKQRRAYEKPSERKTREKSEAVRRARKLARKKAQREGLIPDTRKKKDDMRNGQRPGARPAGAGGFGTGYSPRPPRF
jgi:small subunit ribosomal protein S21